MKVLLTGIAGFIGFHLANKLIKHNYTVIGIDNINDYYDPKLKYDRLSVLGIDKDIIEYGKVIRSSKYPGLDFIKLNLEDREKFHAVLGDMKCDIIINLAAQAGVRYSLENPYAYVDSNINGFLNVLELARHSDIKHLIYASSSSVYGLNRKMPFSTDDNVDHPVSLYAATKKSNELMAHCYSHLYNIPVTGLRFFTVYGPWGRPDMAYYLFTDKIVNDETIKIFNYGDMKRDFTYIDDIVAGIYKLIDHIPQSTNYSDDQTTAPYKLYNIGHHEPVNLNDFVMTLEKLLGKTAKKELLPMQPGDVTVTYADIGELEKEIGFKPETSIEDGLKKFVTWYKEYYRK